MMRYSIQPKNGIFVKGYGFLSFAKNMGKNIGKSFSGKYSPGMLAMRQELLDYAKKSKTDALIKLLQKDSFKSSRSNWWFDW